MYIFNVYPLCLDSSFFSGKSGTENQLEKIHKSLRFLDLSVCSCVEEKLGKRSIILGSLKILHVKKCFFRLHAYSIFKFIGSQYGFSFA